MSSSLRNLPNEVLLDAYAKGQSLGLDTEFLRLLKEEITRRNLSESLSEKN